MYAISSHNTHVCILIGLQTHFWLQTCLPRITHILLSWTICVLMSQRKQFIRVNRMSYIAHTFDLADHSFVFPNHKQFIRVNRMLYIAHTFIWLPVSFVPPHRKQLIELNNMPCITHATKIWTVFDASVIANVLHLFDGFLHHHLWLLHRTQFRRRVSDHSVALAAFCSSAWVQKPMHFPPKSTKNKDDEEFECFWNVDQCFCVLAWLIS